MSARFYNRILFCLLVMAVVSPMLAQNAPFTFESFLDSAALTNQYAGATFANATVLSAGITLDEFEFPTHGGSNVVSDTGGPITISFLSPVRSFGGYFTYSVPLTVQALDSSNNVLASATSTFSNNEGLSGTSGSHPNEFLTVASSAGISRIVITGTAQGTSFTMDDALVITRCDLNRDGQTNAADAQAAIDEALGVRPGADDLTAEGTVNVVDAQIVINAVLGSGCSAK